MRKIERQMLQAIVDDRNWSKDNTRVECSFGCADIYLHGHRIAHYRRSDSSLKINNCGYDTNTTKSRLNVLINFVCDPTKNGIFQKNWDWFLVKDGETFDFLHNQWVALQRLTLIITLTQRKDMATTVQTHLPDVRVISKDAYIKDFKARLGIHNYEVKAAYQHIKDAYTWSKDAYTKITTK